MAYQSNAHDALRAYVAAAAHLYGLPLNAVDYPGLANVNATELGEFILLDSSGRDLPHSRIAICYYFEDDNLWVVQLWTGASVEVLNTGGEFVVVEEHG
jgi:hypothetical protein